MRSVGAYGGRGNCRGDRGIVGEEGGPRYFSIYNISPARIAAARACRSNGFPAVWLDHFSMSSRLSVSAIDLHTRYNLCIVSRINCERRKKIKS